MSENLRQFISSLLCPEEGQTDDQGQTDGGLPPGGAPPQLPCDCGPCPVCSDDRGMSSPCVLLLGHDGDHQCSYGDVWQQAGASATPQRKYCGGPCPVTGCGKTCSRPFIHEPPHMCPLGHTW
jgi:hypothetical protein